MKRSALIPALLVLLASPALADVDKNVKKWIDEVRPIALPEEEKAYKGLKKTEDALEFQKIFWARRDPNLETPENEYQVEYQKLVAEIDAKYRVAGRAGSQTDCGRIHLLLGAPDSVRKEQSAEVAFRTPETWTYKDRPNLTFKGGSLDIPLDGTCMLPQGNRFADQLNRLAERLVIQTTLSYKPDAKGGITKLIDLLPKPTDVQALLKQPRVDFQLDPMSVMEIRSQDGASVFLAGLIRGDASGLAVSEAAGKKLVKLVVAVRATDATGHTNPSQDRDVTAEVDSENKFVSSFGVPVRPGEYSIKVGAVDPKSKKGSVAELAIKTQEYGADLTVSPVMVLADIQESVNPSKDDPFYDFTFGSTRFVPRYGNVFRKGETVTLLCAIFGAAKLETSGFTMAGYEGLKEGISYEEAVRVMGAPGVEGAKSGTTVIYSWQNPDGSNASATFQNGRLTSRAQAGLPPGWKISVAGGFQILKDGKTIAKAPDQTYDTEPATPSAGPVPLGSYPPGKYIAQIRLRDNIAKKDYVKETAFEIVP